MSSAKNRRASLGLRARLTLWSTAVLATSLVLGYAWVHRGLRAVLMARNDAFLESKAAEFSSFPGEGATEGDRESLEAEARREVAANGRAGLVVILRRAGSAEVVPPTARALRLARVIERRGIEPGVQTVDPGDGPGYRIVRIGQGRETVDVALSMAETEATLAQFDRSV